MTLLAGPTTPHRPVAEPVGASRGAPPGDAPSTATRPLRAGAPAASARTSSTAAEVKEVEARVGASGGRAPEAAQLALLAEVPAGGDR